MKTTNNNEPTNTPNGQKPPPDVPKPAGPISGGKPDIFTHSIDNTQKIRLTEGYDHKKSK